MITLTEAATLRIENSLKQRGSGAGIRIAVRSTGCSGLAYVLEYVDEYEHEEGVTNYAQQKFAVLISAKDLPYLNNMTVDYVRWGLNEGFEFRNPNERDRCGCGASFRV
jgi:iron-sulfur cluster assembly protein